MTRDLGINSPPAWSWMPLKHVTTYLGRGSAPDYVEIGSVRAVGQAANQANGLDWARTRFHSYDGDPRSLKGLLVADDILINSTGTGTLGRIGYFCKGPDSIDCMADRHVTIARANEGLVHPRYLYYWLASSIFQDYLHSALVLGATNQIELSRDRLAASPVLLPALDVQRKIVEFLDRETVSIDAIIAAYRRRITLLREQFNVVVRNYVKFGCETQMTSAVRVEWLGEVNPEWRIAHLRRAGRFFMGTTFPHDYQGRREGDFPFVKVADFAAAGPRWEVSGAENWVTADVAQQLRARIVPAGSIAYARVGAAMLLNQRRLIVRPSVIDDNVRALHVTAGDPRYWLYAMSILDMGRLANPGPVPSVGESQVASVKVPVPPVGAQRSIGIELARRADQVDEVRCFLSRQVDTLAERRRALITTVITGQIDVSTASGVAV